MDTYSCKNLNIYSIILSSYYILFLTTSHSQNMFYCITRIHQSSSLLYLIIIYRCPGDFSEYNISIISVATVHFGTIFNIFYKLNIVLCTSVMNKQQLSFRWANGEQSALNLQKISCTIKATKFKTKFVVYNE